MDKNDLIKEAFGALNNYKRHRTLQELQPEQRQYHELIRYKMIDKLELALRAINKDHREGVAEQFEMEGNK